MKRSNLTTDEKQILIVKGDITQSDVDAVVNAANTDLLLGSGVSGAIRKTGGDGIQKECSAISPIPLGEAAVTGGGTLRAKYIIHAAGMYKGGRVDEKPLRDATANSLRRAEELSLRSIAFPALGTGFGGFDTNKCADIMIEIAKNHLSNSQNGLKIIYFVLFDDNSYNEFCKRLDS